MFVLHIALQGCLRGSNVEYGITADTGGHIRYLLGLVEASARMSVIDRVVIATRAFESTYGDDYLAPQEWVTSKIEIVRFRTDNPEYLAKEDLWQETPSFAEALIAWIEEQPTRPDIIHAHYADAGVVASLVRERLGIPYVFIAHSLGRVKQQAFKTGSGRENPDSADAIDKRIEVEERAIADASLIVASSRDEAEYQYADYASYDPGRIRIVPPGAELGTFRGASSSLMVDRMLRRFLTDPEKPPLIAIARPVAKKNLQALVRAYGESKELQEKANLIIVAGNRRDISELEPEIAASMREIIHLVDLYDLYGKVAYPKSHQPSDVPALYGYARYRRGIFVNPALNEPFGLTLLEAAAAGIPVIATDSGGPNDIVEVCRNGELVDPNDPNAIAEAALRILSDDSLWDAYASAGARAVKRFDWRSHAKRYHKLMHAVVREEGIAVPNPTELLVCDIDNTLIGSKDALNEFAEWRAAQPHMALAIASGRSFHSAMSVLEQENAPLPDIMVTSVGSEIYYRRPGHPTYTPDPDWAAYVGQEWDREAVRDALLKVQHLRPQSPLEQRQFKLSYLSGGRHELVGEIVAALEAAGLSCSVIYSHGRYLDVLPRRASKGTAVEFVREKLGLSATQLYVAGDSGNDIEMLKSFPNGIVVANYCDGLASLPELSHCHFAGRRFARGVLDGVEHFREFNLGAAA